MALFYDGGSLSRPNCGAIVGEDGLDLVTFRPSCFNEDGSWRSDVMALLWEIADEWKREDNAIRLQRQLFPSTYRSEGPPYDAATATGMYDRDDGGC